VHGSFSWVFVSPLRWGPTASETRLCIFEWNHNRCKFPKDSSYGEDSQCPSMYFVPRLFHLLLRQFNASMSNMSLQASQTSPLGRTKIPLLVNYRWLTF
jgi:hypothetical protein